MKWVLVIEPSEVDRAYLERIISRLGYKLFVARNGEEALHFMGQSLPSAVIVGEKIPDRDPMEFCRSVKEDWILSSPPMLLVSASGDTAYREAAVQAGYAEVVQRPMSIRKFFTKLELCISNNRRVYIRAPMNIPVRILHGLEEYDLNTHNFGERGLYIPTPNPMPGKSSVRLHFNLPGLRTLFRFTGQVAHTQERDTDEVPAGMGINFVSVSPAIDAVLGIYMENFLVKRLPVAI